MQVNSVSQSDLRNNKFIIPKRNHYSNISFERAYVALTKQNHSKEICQGIDTFNKVFLPDILPIAIKNINKAFTKFYESRAGSLKHPKLTAKYLAAKVKLFILAGGEGSRLRHLSDAMGKIQNESYNKICAPFATKKGEQPFTMLNHALSLLAVCAAKTKTASGKIEEGFQNYIKTENRGTFWHVMDHYMQHPDEIEDTIIMSGDNAFNKKTEDLLKGFALMKEQGQHLLMFGVKKTPEECAKQLGVVTIRKTYKAKGDPRRATNYRALTSFVEKPPLDEAKKLAEKTGGINVANTGGLIISKEAIQKMVEIARKEHPDIIAGRKDRGSFSRITKIDTPDGTKKEIVKPEDLYDFSSAQKWILENMYKPEDIQKGKGPLVYMVKSEDWDDAGTPVTLVNVVKKVGTKRTKGNKATKTKGTKPKFISNFPPKYQKTLASLGDKVTTNPDGSITVLITNGHKSVKVITPEVLQEKLKKGKAYTIIDEDKKTEVKTTIHVVG